MPDSSIRQPALSGSLATKPARRRRRVESVEQPPRDAAVQRADGRLVLAHGVPVGAVAQHEADAVGRVGLGPRREAERRQGVLHRVLDGRARRPRARSRGRSRGRRTRCSRGASLAASDRAGEPARELGGRLRRRAARPRVRRDRPLVARAAARAGGSCAARAGRRRRAAGAARGPVLGWRPTRSASSARRRRAAQVGQHRDQPRADRLGRGSSPSVWGISMRAAPGRPAAAARPRGPPARSHRSSS